MQDGPAQLSAPLGLFHYDSNRIDIHGPVVFTANGGYRFMTSNITIDLRANHASGTGGVSGAVPSGTFSAARIDVDLNERTVSLTGGARLQMQPGQLKAPGQ
jgi:lipopolysaccharide export system protein LptC